MQLFMCIVVAFMYSGRQRAALSESIFLMVIYIVDVVGADAFHLRSDTWERCLAAIASFQTVGECHVDDSHQPSHSLL